MSNYAHPVVTERHHRVGVFSIAVWIVGVVVAVWFFFVTINIILASVIIALTVFLGWPIPDVGTPIEWVIREWHRRAQWKRDKGRMIAPALFGEPPGPPCDFELVEGVLASGETGFLPIFTDSTRAHATVTLRLSGASQQWLGSDADGKSSWNLAYCGAMAQALGVTRVPDLRVFFTHGHRPADVESMFRLARVRYDEEARNAAISDPDSVKGKLGLNLAERISMNYGSGGNPLELVSVRMPWPRGWGGRVGVSNADAFKRTALSKTVAEVRGAYESLGVTANFLSPLDAQHTWDELFNVTDLPAFRRYRELDRVQRERARAAATAETNSTELVEAEAEADELELQMTQSLRSTKPTQPGILCYGRTHHIAGYVKRVKKPLLSPAFKQGFHLPDDVYWTETVLVEAVLRDKEALKEREKERGINATEGLNPLNRGVTDPDGDQKWSEVTRKRRRLRNAGNRVPHVIIMFSVAASSAAKAEEDWETLLTRLGPYYELERLEYRDDIEDVLLAGLGLDLLPI